MYPPEFPKSGRTDCFCSWVLLLGVVSLEVEEEEHGAEVPKPMEEVVHRLVGQFFTKRTLNVESVARTFKPLWKPTGELKL